MSSQQIHKLELEFVSINDPVKYVDYISTLKGIDEIDELIGILVPYESEKESDYNIEILIQHIRTDNNEKIARARIILEDQSIENQENVLDAVWFPEFFFSDIGSEKIAPLDERSWKKDYNNIGLEPRKTSGSRHDQANKWGVYRLLKFLNHSGIKNKVLEKYGNDLSNNDLFFKKLINKELEDDNWKTQTLSNKKLEKIKKLEYKIALIDDQAEYGWTEAFKYLFKNSKIYSFISAKDFEKEKENWNKFDIVFLDLRLEGDQETNNILLSGNKLLKKIKTKNPELPVIISTASNKYNNLLDSINYGAHDYWVKESYELGLKCEYNIENSNKLLDSINKCIVWNNEKRPIIEELTRLENKITQHWQQKGVKKRKAFIISQLHNSFSSFLGENQEKTRMESIYIAAYSILNEIMEEYYIIELDPEDRSIELIKYNDGIETEIFAKKYRDPNHNYKLNDDIFPLFGLEQNKTYQNIDRFKILYIGYKNKPNSFNPMKTQFNLLKKYRNNSTLIHGNYDDSADSRTISYKDILKLLSFINRLISIEDI